MSNKLLSIVCLSCLPFIFTLNGDFVFDDSEAVVKNKDITSESWSAPFFNDFWGADIKSNLSHKSYRPLTVLSYRLNYLFNKRELNAFQFKTTNLVCHVICCILMWKTFENITEDNSKSKRTIVNQDAGTNENRKPNGKLMKWWTDTPYLATLLFCVHPVHVEAVCGIVGRADLLAAITFFLSFICYHKSVISEKYKCIYSLPAVIIAGISMLCKENGVTVLAVCLIYEITTKLKIKRKDSTNTRNLSVNMGENVIHLSLDSIIRIIVVVTAIIGLLYVRWTVMGETKPVFYPTDNPAAYAKTIFTKVATYNYIYFVNILLLVWPQWLCYDWSMGCIQLVENFMDFRLILILLMYLYGILLLKSITNGKNRKSNNRLVIMAISLTIIPFLPAANIFYPVGFVIAERILYIPSAGYCLLIVIGFNKLLHNRSLFVYKIGVFMFLLLLLLYAVRCWQRSVEWQNEYKLFVSGLFVCPLNAKVRYNVAKVADANHQTTWAIAEYKEAIRLFPGYYQATNNLANLLKYEKKFVEAEFYLRAAVSLKSDFPAAWMNLGIVLANTGRFSESEAAYKTAISYRKKYPACYYNLGNLWQFIDALLKEISWSGGNKFFRGILAGKEKNSIPERQYKMPLKNLLPPDQLISLRRASINCHCVGKDALIAWYLEMNKTEDAMNSWFQAINQNPKYVLAWTNLLALLDNTGQIEMALKIIPRVLTELPEAPSVNFVIANMYGKINRYGEAEAHFMKAIKLLDKDVQAIHYTNLGVLYHRWKKYNLAKKMYKKALKIDPMFKTAHKNLESLQKFIT